MRFKESLVMVFCAFKLLYLLTNFEGWYRKSIKKEERVANPPSPESWELSIWLEVLDVPVLGMHMCKADIKPYMSISNKHLDFHLCQQGLQGFSMSESRHVLTTWPYMDLNV